MNGIELLEKYPKAAAVALEWYKQQIIDTSTGDVSQDFIDHLISHNTLNGIVTKIIDKNPRLLFDLFDENEIHIFILPMHVPLNSGISFTYYFLPDKETLKNVECDSRKEAEGLAIEEAFKMLEEKLTQKVSG